MNKNKQFLLDLAKVLYFGLDDKNIVILESQINQLEKQLAIFSNIDTSNQKTQTHSNDHSTKDYRSDEPTKQSNFSEYISKNTNNFKGNYFAINNNDKKH